MEKEVLITTPYITLAQLLMEDVLLWWASKMVFTRKTVYYNDEPEIVEEKLYDGDAVRV